jgi:para-nitrobenzyl esterase
MLLTMQHDDQDPVVTVAPGRLRGRRAKGVSAFLGVPYATTSLFGTAEPVTRWDGVRDAAELGPTAPQPPYEPPFDQILENPRIPGEEFLNVNVWTPDPGGSGLPVMVWLPGGAYRNGSNASPVYDGAAFARDGVVLVSVNYRLGAAGFAVVEDAPSNRGTSDQVAALAWVRDNIAAFGGDPDRVTLFGESAGGMSVATLLSVPATDGLFSRAIVQSGTGTAVAEPHDAAILTASLAERLDTEPTAAALGAIEVDKLIAAQQALAQEIRQQPDPQRWGTSVIAAGRGIMSFIPVVDGELIPRRPVDAIAAGAARGVDLMAGSTAEEFRLFLVPTGVTAAVTAEVLPAMVAGIGADPAMAAAYSEARPDAGPGDVFAAILTDAAFRIPATRLAEGQVAAGGTAYLYEFGWRSPAGGLGACHALELPFVFDTLGSAVPMTGPEPPQPLADRMHAAWVAFATTGDPGWQPYDTDTRKVMTFDHPASSVVEDPRQAERLLWDGWI